VRAFERNGFRRVAELSLPAKRAVLLLRERGAAGGEVPR
jgi:hypothetical protein